MRQHNKEAPPHTDGHVIHWAWLYDSVIRVTTLGQEQRLRRQTIELAELRPGQRVLDIGCGTGTLLIGAAQAEPGIRAQGIDPAPEMIERARRKAASAGVEATFEVGTIENLELAAETVDVAMCSLMLHHLPTTTLHSGLVEIFRVLKPGGRLVVIDFPGPGPMLHRLSAVLTRGRSPTRHVDEVLAQLKELGFTNVVRGRPRPGFLFSVVARKPD
jgi:ubiquinone/menaquinone biosynthesis C-methylase UbiE